VNYEVLGDSLDFLHGHVHARYDWEPPDKVGGPVWRYAKDERYSDEFAYSDERHGQTRKAISDALHTLMRRAYT
jgi:diadenosine tetraphosphate (Ap4A) HIT family hydrolase